MARYVDYSNSLMLVEERRVVRAATLIGLYSTRDKGSPRHAIQRDCGGSNVNRYPKLPVHNGYTPKAAQHRLSGMWAYTPFNCGVFFCPANIGFRLSTPIREQSRTDPRISITNLFSTGTFGVFFVMPGLLTML